MLGVWEQFAYRATSFWTNKCCVEGAETSSHKNALKF